MRDGDGGDIPWEDEELPPLPPVAAPPASPSGKSNGGDEVALGDEVTPAQKAVDAWRAGMASPWKRPASKPAPPPSILRLNGADAGPFRGSAGILAGAGGIGKSWAALDLACKVAAGQDVGPHLWCGFDIMESGRVVYVAAEDPESVLAGRLYDLSAGLTDVQRARLSERLHVVSLADSAPELLRVWRISRQMEPNEAADAGLACKVVTDDAGLPVSLRSPNVSEVKTLASELMEAMKKSLSGAGVVLVVMDPLSRLGGSDAETDNAVAARLMRELGGLAVAADAAVLVVHHTTKAARGKDSADGTGVRGSSALMDGSRWAAELTATKTGALLTVTKASYAKAAFPVHLRRGDGGILRAETAGERDERLAAEEAETKPTTRKAKGSGKPPSKPKKLGRFD